MKCETTSQIDSRAGQCVVCTLEVAVVIERASCPYERAEVEAADKSAVAGKESVGVGAYAYLGLDYGVTTSLTVERGVERIVEVYVAIIAHGHVFDREAVAGEMEHGEVADGSLGLAAVDGKHHVGRIVGESDYRQSVTLYLHCIGEARGRTAHSRVVGIVEPVDRGGHHKCHAAAA